MIRRCEFCIEYGPIEIRSYLDPDCNACDCKLLPVDFRDELHNAIAQAQMMVELKNRKEIRNENS